MIVGVRGGLLGRILWVDEMELLGCWLVEMCAGL